jgi:hypothetical protein
MNHDWYNDYYRQSRGYGPGEIAELYRQPAETIYFRPKGVSGAFCDAG